MPSSQSVFSQERGNNTFPKGVGTTLSPLFQNCRPDNPMEKVVRDALLQVYLQNFKPSLLLQGTFGDPLSQPGLLSQVLLTTPSLVPTAIRPKSCRRDSRSPSSPLFSFFFG
ncbi:hypothetical protein EAI_02800 [Harpegnathos saltator]|uniref:Uncharacterized protein n=1 Tax=Harpegnathos saltator TaxID=610380 RepID=E2BAW6_HARSA|nr:hypothetical protein EAI_02982 [Harpegnathos saltator]EFN87164.1 hypothetical protein EAI_02800 [Harpegnathos saltator]